MFWPTEKAMKGGFPVFHSALRARTHGQKETQKWALLQINVPRVMILPQKLEKLIWQGDIYLTVRDIYLRWRVIHLRGMDIYLTGRDIYFEKGHNFVANQYFDHVCESLGPVHMSRKKSLVSANLHPITGLFGSKKGLLKRGVQRWAWWEAEGVTNYKYKMHFFKYLLYSSIPLLYFPRQTSVLRSVILGNGEYIQTDFPNYISAIKEKDRVT